MLASLRRSLSNVTNQHHHLRKFISRRRRNYTNIRPSEETCDRPKASDVFFQYTSGNWLCNNEAHKAARYVKFDVDALCRIAANAVNAKTVTHMVKINESLNKIFLLQFDNGKEAIARIPTSLSGPPHYTTASEVATMDFLRRQLGFPIPAVLAWSSRADETEVGAEFILMEKAPGLLLSDVWEDVPARERGLFADTLAKLETRLLSLKFSHYGSLYYKNDVPKALRAPTVLQDVAPDDEIDSTFCIGPITRRDFWEAERANMEINRGPWCTAEEYMISVARREQDWITQFGTPHILDDPNRILPCQGSRSEYVDALSQYIDLVPHIIPKGTEQTIPILWHADLHSSNLFIVSNEEGDKKSADHPLAISSIIDWQGAWIGPAFLQLQVPPLFRIHTGVPSGFRLPALPEDYGTLDESGKEDATKTRQRALAHKVYEAAAFPAEIMRVRAREERTHLEVLTRDLWKYGLIPFRTALATIYGRWDDIAVPGTLCPLSFSPEELGELGRQHDMWIRHQLLSEELDQKFCLGEFGFVGGDDEHFFQVGADVERKRLAHIQEGKDEDDRLVRELLWPYRDTLKDSDRHLPRMIFAPPN